MLIAAIKKPSISYLSYTTFQDVWNSRPTLYSTIACKHHAC